MTRKPTSAAASVQPAVRVVVVTMDQHLASATERARLRLQQQVPGLQMTMYAAADWGHNPQAAERCCEAIAQADIVIATMLFMEDHFLPVLPALQARREACDAMVCVMSAGEVAKLTKLGKFDMAKPASAPIALLKRLRGQKGTATQGGAQQMKMLRRIPQLLRFIPGTAQDVRAYFLAMQYWLGGSQDNMVSLVRMLIDRYAQGPRAVLRGTLPAEAPVAYPDVGVYHPRLPGCIGELAQTLPAVVPDAQSKGRVGLLLLRSYLLAGNTKHYDGVIAALEVQGLQVVPVFAAGLDARPAIERYLMKDGKPSVDALLSLTGFSLVGGPAYNDARAAEAVLAQLDVPYIAAQPLEFQTLTEWEGSERGLSPVESTIMVAIPELDGATQPMVFGGRSGGADMDICTERVSMLAQRVAARIALTKTPRAKRKLAIVLFNFPPNAGATGTAAFLSVFESLYQTLKGLKQAGWQVELPADVNALRCAVLEGNARLQGSDANVHTRIAVDDHVRREKHLAEIEAQWGPAPGKHLTDGRSLLVLGAQFGQVLVAVQPGMGYEGDPMRLLFERGFAPTHAFCAFYRYLREDFGANAVLHFGTHGALEFMPGKQAGLSGDCWPERLIGAMPNFYLYAVNNPSEGTLAKRRGGATLLSYLTPPVTQAGLYRGLSDLKSSIERWRALVPHEVEQRVDLAALLQTQASALNLCEASPPWNDAEREVQALLTAVHEFEHTLIPEGLHVVGVAPDAQQRLDLLQAMVADDAVPPPQALLQALAQGKEDIDWPCANAEQQARLEQLQRSALLLAQDSEVSAIVHALDGRFVRPAPGGDVLRTPEVLPTGRNVHGFDPFRIPSAFALREGARCAEQLIARHLKDERRLPDSVALVLWGTDNLKTEGSPIGQALALMGAAPRFDSYGRLAGAQLLPLAQLGRARIDVVITMSGIFRDLLPLQIKLLAEAAFLAASADEPPEHNAIRRHALAYQQTHGCDLETAALRVFGNANGTYGANVNHLVDSSRWDDEDELAETYSRRKGFAYGRAGQPMAQAALLQSVLADVSLTTQNLDSVELGVTTIDTYFDTLGGISRAVQRAQGGKTAPVYIGDGTRGKVTIRTLSEQVALETHTRMLNPKWYEAMLSHGYEGVRHIESHVTNTMGWSATTGQVQPWVYQKLSETFVLDAAMRDRLARLNPAASAKVANRLLEASRRRFWQPDAATLAALERAGEELEDRLEGVFVESTAGSTA
jgi:magnesium chelatase subunit H